MFTISRCVLLLIFATFVCADEIDIRFKNGVMLKLLREMVNQTKADTLNLPANATSIRQNITDTFKCENRTYGYYADVDNECQIFHVCLTSQGASGRNVTYRWSFICPNETIFNQELLTCTRPRDSIDCEESPMYYDVNMEIGKVNNTMDTENNTNDNKVENKPNKNRPNNNANMKIKDKKKQNNRRKQNLIVERIMEEVENEDKDNFQAIDFGDVQVEDINGELLSPIVEEVKPVYGEEYAMNGEVGDSRVALERNVRRRGRKISRGSFRFKADV